MITTAILLGHVLLALALIVLILLQHGKGADAGAAFGSGASSTVFGSQGSGSFMSRATKWLAILFFITSGTLAYLASDRQATVAPSVMDVEPVIESRDEPEDQLRDQDLPPVDAPAEEEQAAEPAEDMPEEDAPPPNGDGGGAN